MSTRVEFSSRLDQWSPDVRKNCILKSSDIFRLFVQGSRTLNKTLNCNWTQHTSKGEGCKTTRRLKLCRRLAIKYLIWTRRSRRDQDNFYRSTYKCNHYRVRGLGVSTILTTAKFDIDSSLPKTVQPALSTATQGEQKLQHGIGLLRRWLAVQAPVESRDRLLKRVISTPPQWCACSDIFVTRDCTVSPLEKMSISRLNVGLKRRKRRDRLERAK